MKYNRYLLLLLSIFTSHYLYAQGEGDNTKVPKIIPPSPDASSLGKFGEVPVSKYTGVPQISIPLYSIAQRDIQIPVSLSYHAGGIKVEERSSWVGLGWALNAGGVITRSMVGLPDEDPGGYLNQPYDIENFNLLSEQTQRDIFNDVNAGALDLEPDMYSFNVMGMSGKFIIDKATKTGIASPNQHLKILMPGAAGNNPWEIIDDKGFKYIFAATETSTVENVSGPTRTGSFTKQYSSSWYLTSIVSPTGNSITIDYQDYTSEYFTLQGGSRYFFLGGEGRQCSMPQYDYDTYIHNMIQGKRIKSINTENGKIKFIKSVQSRLDIPNDYSLDFVEVYDRDNNLLKRYKFSYSYFQSDAFSNPDGLDDFHKRLRLDKVEDITVLSQPLPYLLEYISGALPSVFSKSQDHWGFFNGASNASLIPLNTSTGIGGGTVTRAVNFDFAKIGTLSRITYPTGGTSTFDYESNEASISEDIYQGFFYPYGPSSSQYLQDYSSSINYNQQSTTFYVDPQTTKLDAYSNINYTVRFDDGRTCSGGDRTCIGSVQIIVTCTDCGSIGVSVADLTPGDFINGVSEGKIFLIPGKHYALSMSGPDPDLQLLSAKLLGTKEALPMPGNSTFNVQAGGLRIKKTIVDAGTTNPVITDYLYSSNMNLEPTSTFPAESSGSFVTYPSYEPEDAYIRKSSTQLGNFCAYKVRSSSSKVPLVGTGGGSVGYSEVQTFQSDGLQKLKTLSSFSSPKEFPDFVSYNYPYTVTLSRENLRGDLLAEKFYSYRNGQYTISKSVINTYSMPLQYRRFAPGARFAITLFVEDAMMNSEFTISDYRLVSEWKYIESTTTTTYEQDGTNPLTTTVNYSYENPVHQQLTRSDEINSKGDHIVTALVYPQDYVSGNTMTDELVTKHIVGIPIETVKYKSTSGNVSILSATAVTFKPGGAGLKDEVFAIETTSPIQLNSFKFSNKVSGILPYAANNSTTFSLDNRYKSKLTYNAYDGTGNILQYAAEDGLVNSFLYGYNKNYPVARIIGTNHTTVAALVNQTVLDDPSSTEQQIEAQLNNLRNGLASARALVTTYKYKPLVGMTSQTDPTGKTTYYEYDSIGRLLLIRDKDGNILKKYDYHYSQ